MLKTRSQPPGASPNAIKLPAGADGRPPVIGLIDPTGIITPPPKVYLRDCYDHLVQIMDIIGNYREMASSLMDIYLSGMSIRLNDIMRVLTVISSIFIPLTFIAGVYGMNFDKDAGPLSMPELKKPYGYVICLAFMAFVAFGQLFIFWRKGWLKKDA